MEPTKDSKIDDGNYDKTTSTPTGRVTEVKLGLTAMCDSWLSFALRGFFLEGLMFFCLPAPSLSTAILWSRLMDSPCGQPEAPKPTQAVATHRSMGRSGQSSDLLGQA